MVEIFLNNQFILFVKIFDISVLFKELRTKMDLHQYVMTVQNSLHCHCFGEYLELDTLHCTSQ